MAVPHRGVIAILWWLSAMLLWGGGAALAAEPENADVRVLIDISGSMRKNDPDNLRRPALRMLAGLLQPGTRAGVWTFARWVNNLVPVAEVDAVWKKRSQSLSKQISSPGQFTNIEEVLDAASLEPVQPDLLGRRAQGCGHHHHLVHRVGRLHRPLPGDHSSHGKTDPVYFFNPQCIQQTHGITTQHIHVIGS